MMFARTPDPPYHVAVITVRRTGDDDGYLAAADELAVQRLGQERWYEEYTVRVGLVERQYSWRRPG